VTTDRSRPVTSSRGDVVWVFVAVFALALIGVKVGNLFDLHLPWLYAVAAGANVGIVSVHVSRQRRRTRPLDRPRGSALRIRKPPPGAPIENGEPAAQGGEEVARDPAAPRIPIARPGRPRRAAPPRSPPSR
jgi:hypothetical protein